MSLEAMIREARTLGRVLHCSYQDMWFTPDELEAENRVGRFCWGPQNFELRLPGERTAQLERKLTTMQGELENWKKRIQHLQPKAREE